MSSSQFDLKLLMQVVGFDEAKAAMDKLGASTDTLVASQPKAGTASESMGQKITKQKTSVLGLSSSFGTIITSSWSLYNAWDSLEKVQLASDKANTKVKSSQIALVNAQDKLTAAIAKYGAGSKEAAQAQDVVVKATEQLANAQETAAIRAGDVTEANAQFMTTLPIMVTGILSSVTAFGSMAKGFEGIHRTSPMVQTAIKGVSAAFDFLTAHPIVLVLTAVATVFVLLATNAFGFRDAVNALGVAIGDMFPFLKETLDLIGGAANWFLNLINPINQTGTAFGGMGTAAQGTITPIGAVGTALTELETQAVETGDATKLSVENQITLYKQLGTEAEALQLSLTAQLQLRTEAEQEHADKYAEFVTAMEDEDQKLRDSMGVTKEEFDKLYEEWQKDIADFAKGFESDVNKIVKNYELWADTGRNAQTDLITQLGELETKLTEHYRKREEGEKMDKDARREWRKELREIQGEIETLTGSVSTFALESAEAWTTFADQGKEMMNKVSLEMLGGNFNAAVEHVLTAFDDAPTKYKANFEPLKDIMLNPFLETDTKLQLMIAQWDKLDPYKSFIVAGVEYNKTNAELAAGLDELTAAALRNTTEQSNMAMKWEEFVEKLKPAEKSLPIVKAAMEGVADGAITAKDAFAMVAAAGVEMSTVLGEDVVLSMEALKTTTVDLPGPMKAVFATINGEFVKVAEVADNEFVSGNTSVQKSMQTTSEQAATLETDINTALGVKLPADIKKMVTDGNTQFKAMVTNMTTMKTGIVNQKPAIVQAFEDIGEGIKTAWDSMIEALKSAWEGFVSWYSGGSGGGGIDATGLAAEWSKGFAQIQNKTPAPKVQNMEISATDIDKAALQDYANFVSQKTTEISAYFVTMKTSIQSTMGVLNTILTTFSSTALTTVAIAVSTQTTTMSAAFLTMKTSVTATMTALQTALGAFASTAMTTVATAVISQTTVMSAAFLTMKTSVTATMTALQTTLTTFVTTTTTSLTTISTSLVATQTAFSTFSTSVVTYTTSMTTNIQKFATTTVTSLTTINAAMTKTQQASSTLSTTISSHMKSMTSAVSSFASSFSSSMSKITSSMNTATSAAQKLKSAIDALKSKTITITTRYVTQGSPAGQHGYTGITNAPGSVGGVRTGEGFRPELITVTPLTRGTGNHMGATLGGGFGSPGGRGGGGEVVNNITVVLDGRVIQKFVEKTALAGLGSQI